MTVITITVIPEHLGSPSTFITMAIQAIPETLEVHMDLFTTKIIAAITGTVVLALTGAIFYVAGQNSELREELSRTKNELTTNKQQVKTLESTIDQAHSRIRSLSAHQEVAEYLSSRKITRLKNDLDFCEVSNDFIFRHYAPKRVQENMRKAMLATDGMGHTEDPVNIHMIRD